MTQHPSNIRTVAAPPKACPDDGRIFARGAHNFQACGALVRTCLSEYLIEFKMGTLFMITDNFCIYIGVSNSFLSM